MSQNDTQKRTTTARIAVAASITSRPTGASSMMKWTATTVASVASTANPTPQRIGRRNWVAFAASRYPRSTASSRTASSPSRKMIRNDWLVTRSGAVSPGLDSFRSASSTMLRSSTIRSRTSSVRPSRIAWRTSANFDSASSVNWGSATRSGISTYSKWLR